MTNQHFESIIIQTGQRVGILLPFNPNEVWGEKPQHHVTGQVNGHKIRGPLRVEELGYFLPLGEAWRRDSGLAGGQSGGGELSPEGPQSENLTADIREALEAEPQAKAFFDGLATFYRNNYIRWIEGTRRPETRRARLAETVELLKAGQKQAK
jgi:hypothetical protein